MDIGIGATLREARNRRKVDLSEVEAATQIRVRYLRAIENEEWDVLPGDVYVRSFIRTYASHLGLDGERLAEEYRRSVSSTGSERPAPGVEPGTVGRSRTAVQSRARSRAVAVAVVAALVGVVAAIGLATDDDPTLTVSSQRKGTVSTEENLSPPATPQPQRSRLELELTATGEVWVCLLDADGQPLVNGQILAEGMEEGPFRSGSFTASFGNGEVSMLIDGREADIPETSSPVGYAIGDGGTLEPLTEGERPTCL